MKTLICALLGLGLAGGVVSAQTTAFTYQGRLLNSTGLTNTPYDLLFTLYDTATLPNNVVGTPITNAPVAVAADGLFTVNLDFGSAAFAAGNDRWLQIGVRTNGDTNAYITLTPRQFLTSTPYAIRSLFSGTAATATTATNLAGPLAATNLTGIIVDARLSTNVAFLNSNQVFKANVTAVQFIGNGLGLTNIPFANTTGTVPDNRLTANVALQSGSVNFAGSGTFGGSVTATNFIGNGFGLTNVPGRLFDFVPVATTVQAFGNFGYLATNDVTTVVVTLPTSPVIGQTVRVSGSGAAGWVIAQNAGQSILTANLPSGLGLGWTQRDSGRNWKGAAASADGRKLVAVVNSSGGLFTSADYGATWGGVTPTLNWQGVASSGDGVKLVAVPNNGQIHVSVNSGGSWSPRDSTRAWSAVASSFDGTKLVAVVGSSGSIYRSVDSGGSWTPTATNLNWTGVASSADGQKLVAVASGGRIHTSSNGGSSWVPRDSVRAWTCVASSYDGSILAAGVNNGLIYVSTDSGVTWGATATSQTWTGIACSGDGSKMAAVFSVGGISTSTDSGRTWALSSFSTLGFTSTAISGDGSTMFAAATSSPLLVYSQVSTTVGTAGFLSGTRLSAIELQYVGGGQFMPVNQIGAVRPH